MREAIYPGRDVTGPVSQDCCGSRRLQGGESVAQAAGEDTYHPERHPAARLRLGRALHFCLSGIKKKNPLHFPLKQVTEFTHKRGRKHRQPSACTGGWGQNSSVMLASCVPVLAAQGRLSAPCSFPRRKTVNTQLRALTQALHSVDI